MATGQNLKLLIKHKSFMLFSFLKFTSSWLIFHTIPDFFNRLVICTTLTRHLVYGRKLSAEDFTVKKSLGFNWQAPVFFALITL